MRELELHTGRLRSLTLLRRIPPRLTGLGMAGDIFVRVEVVSILFAGRSVSGGTGLLTVGSVRCLVAGSSYLVLTVEDGVVAVGRKHEILGIGHRRSFEASLALVVRSRPFIGTGDQIGVAEIVGLGR